VDEQRLPSRHDDQRRLPALDVDEVDIEGRARRTDRRRGQRRQSCDDQQRRRPPSNVAYLHTPPRSPNVALLHTPPFLKRFSHRRSGRPSGRPSDGLKPVAYVQVETALNVARLHTQPFPLCPLLPSVSLT